MREQMKMVNGQFATATPESQGIRSESIIRLMDAIIGAGIELHSLYVVRNGKAVAAGNAKPFTAKSYHRIQSAGKAVISTAVLLAIQEGLIGLDDKVVDYFPEELPEQMDEKFQRLTVYHLLTMTTGHAEDTLGRMMDTDNWVREFFSIPLKHEPGTFFLYNNGVPHILACVIQKATGQLLPDYMKPRLTDPLGLDILFAYNEKGELDGPMTCLTPESFVKFALLYLQEGEWEGRRILDRELVRMAGSALVSTAALDWPDRDSRAGYGFQLWRNAAGGYRFTGGGGQYAMIFPDANLAVVTMSFSQQFHQIPELVTDCLYRHIQARPYPENPRMLRELNDKLARFTLAPVPASAASSRCAELSGRVFGFDENEVGLERFSIEFGQEQAIIRYTQNGKAGEAPCAYHGEWAAYQGDVIIENDYSRIAPLILGYEPGESLLSGGWTDDDTFRIHIRSHASMSTGTILCDFRFGSLTLTLIPAKMRGRNPRTREVAELRPIVLTAK
jgi:CubicO group peptidase (beta-lactamase class C family)